MAEKMSFISSRLQAAKGVAAAPAQESAAKAVDSAVAQSVISHSVDISALKSELEKVRSDLALHKARVSELENCLVMLDEHVQKLQKEHLKDIVDKIKSVADAQEQLGGRVMKVESNHDQLAGSLDDRILNGVTSAIKQKFA
jgi:chorismate synthase